MLEIVWVVDARYPCQEPAWLINEVDDINLGSLNRPVGGRWPSADTAQRTPAPRRRKPWSRSRDPLLEKAVASYFLCRNYPDWPVCILGNPIVFASDGKNEILLVGVLKRRKTLNEAHGNALDASSLARMKAGIDRDAQPPQPSPRLWRRRKLAMCPSRIGDGGQPGLNFSIECVPMTC